MTPKNVKSSCLTPFYGVLFEEKQDEGNVYGDSHGNYERNTFNNTFTMFYTPTIRYLHSLMLLQRCDSEWMLVKHKTDMLRK